MASTAASYNPTRDDFAAMLDESFAGGNLQESSVIKGKVVAIEKDMAVIDVGLKTEGRVALREFAGPGRESDLKIGDEVEVFLDRIENALGEAVLSHLRHAFLPGHLRSSSAACGSNGSPPRVPLDPPTRVAVPRKRVKPAATLPAACAPR